MGLVALGHVLGDGGMPVRNKAADMGSDAFAAMENLHRAGGGAGFQLLPGELIGDAVLVSVDLDVIIDVGPDSLPIREDVTLGG
jgi:hypothetical protein